jgi:malate dehydrogenase
VPEGIVFSFPVTCKAGEYEIVKGLELDDLSKTRLKASERELLEEKAIIQDLL